MLIMIDTSEKNLLKKGSPSLILDDWQGFWTCLAADGQIDDAIQDVLMAANHFLPLTMELPMVDHFEGASRLFDSS